MDHTIWSDMFHLGVPVAEKILRPIVVYVFLLVGMRITGRRTIAQLNPLDFVVLMMLANSVQNAIIGEDNTVLGGLIGAGTLLVANAFCVRFLYTHKKVREVVEGKRDVLIENGVLLEDHLKGELITKSQLASVAHAAGIQSLREVERAILEPTGAISFVEKEPTPVAIRQRELLTRLDEIAAELKVLHATQASARPS